MVQKSKSEVFFVITRSNTDRF